MLSRRKRRAPLVRVGVPVVVVAAVGVSAWGFSAANASQPDRHRPSPVVKTPSSTDESLTPNAERSSPTMKHTSRPTKKAPSGSKSPSPTAKSPSPTTTQSPKGVKLPPVGAGFDYQIGGAYTPPSGVGVVSRDNGDSPAKGLYNICYVNAFQSQPSQKKALSSLLLKDSDGDPAEDPDWEGEYALDLTTQSKRSAVAQKMYAEIDSCAAKGFDAIEPDNYDSFTRFDGISAANAKAYMSLLVKYAHGKKLAVAQKNTVELAPDAKSLGIDFAITEECGAYNECGDYQRVFGSHVIDIEYTAKGLKTACSKWSGKFSIVQRDEEVSEKGSGDYVRKTCGA